MRAGEQRVAAAAGKSAKAAAMDLTGRRSARRSCRVSSKRDGGEDQPHDDADMQPRDRQDMREPGGDEIAAAPCGGMACSSPVSSVTAMAPVATGSVARMRAAISVAQRSAAERAMACRRAGAVTVIGLRAKPVAARPAKKSCRPGSQAPG